MPHDQYERTLWRLIEATEDEGLQWTSVSPTSYEEFVTNADRVMRAFICDLALKDTKSYPILFVERKDITHDDFGQEFERIECEVYILNSNYRLIFPIYNGLVDRDDLFRLLSAISSSNDQAREFFDALGGDEEDA